LRCSVNKSGRATQRQWPIRRDCPIIVARETSKAAQKNSIARNGFEMGKNEEHFQQLEALTPALRRLARALASGAGVAAADELVQAALQRIGGQIRARELKPADAAQTRFFAYAALVDVAGRQLRGAPPQPTGSRHPEIVHGLADLPYDERATLMLVALEGFNYEDAAKLTGASLDQAMARLMRARAALTALGRPSTPQEGARRAASHLRVVK
jgi:RNA polymerase sigma-70 factor, ECF subfamily